MHGAFFKQLNLTDDQKAKMKQIRENFAQTNKPLRGQLRAKRQELHQASEGATFNEALAPEAEETAACRQCLCQDFILRQECYVLTPAENAA